MRIALTCLGTAVVALLSYSAPAISKVKIKLVEFAGGLTHPLAMVPIPDGSGRKAVIEQHGKVRIIDARGRLRIEPFLDVSAKLPMLDPSYDERGLLGIAFHPNYRENGKFYVSYSIPLRGSKVYGREWWPHTNIVSEFTVSHDDPNKADEKSERILSHIDWPLFDAHWIGFGPDGMLYISTGDGGYPQNRDVSHKVTENNSQNKLSPHGKILRIDVEGAGDQIPPDNPFIGQSDALPEIWALGLRNPWRCSFDRGGRNELFCGDAQQSSYEEVNIVSRGANFGWARMEGDRCFDYDKPVDHPADCDKTGLTMPILVYNNCSAKPEGCKGLAVIGGYVYRGKHKAWDGKYIFGDWSKSFDEMDGQIFFATRGADGSWSMEEAEVEGMERLPYILAFAQDDDGEVFVLTSISTGPVGGNDKIYRIVPADG